MWDPNVLLAVADSLSVGVWVGEVETGRLLYCNEAFCELMGARSRMEPPAGAFTRMYRLHDLNGQLYGDEVLFEADTLVGTGPQILDDLVVHRPDGLKRNLRCEVHPVFGPGGALTGKLLIFEDITAERRAEALRREQEARIRRDARMDAVGQLAAGLALDFNNLLATAQILVSTLKMSEPDPLRRQDLAQVQESLGQAVQITRSLKSFGGRRGAPVERFSVREVVDSVARLITRISDAGLEVAVERLSGRDTLEGHPGEIEQALWVLAMRARQRMPQGGRLTLRTSDLLLGTQDGMCRPPLEAGWHIVIDVLDTGERLSPAARERIFEPYPAEATHTPAESLGLATAYATIRSHGGILDVIDTAEGGSALRVLLPAVDDRSAALLPPFTVRRGAGRILVVDDDNRVLGATGSALRAIGYEVMLAPGGAEAVEQFKATGADAVVLDLVMPGMDGLQTMAALRAIDPEARVLLTTGLDAADVPLSIGKVHRYLRKPFGIEELSTALAGLLHL